ncbi:HAD family hydrolase [Bacillus sp. JJ722]|uniref:HAD family hydrolase n=1 Tax=Bacillus sp. JJ722 TaxID=3122973 RepID=UPI0030003862
MIKAVIFDMDGLMFDSESLGLRIIEEVMNDYPYKFDENLNKSIIGMNRELARKEYCKMYDEAFPFDEFMLKKHKKTMKYYDDFEVPKKPGLVELLTLLKQENISVGLATSTYREEAEFMLKRAGVLDFFTITVCGNEVEHSKPHPEIYEHALSKLHVQASEAIVLEDSENGLRAAQAAGISTVFVKDLITPCSDVLKGVTHQVETLHDVITLIKNQGL